MLSRLFDLGGKPFRLEAQDGEAFRERPRRTMPLGCGGEPDESVGAALHFASGASSATTGAVLGVQGGAA